MKILFFLSLLANVVFFLWQYQAGAFQPTEQKSLEPTLTKQKIWLLSELKQSQPVTPTRVAIVEPKMPAQPLVPTDFGVANLTQRNIFKQTEAFIQHLQKSHEVVVAAASLVPAQETRVEKPRVCYKITGFATKTVALRWSKRHAGEAFKIKEIPPVVSDYQVNYPAAELIKLKKNNVEFLKARGINDFFIIHQGELKGSISLGVFKNEMNAINTQRYFLRKGIPAKITKRYKEANVTVQFKTDLTHAQLTATLNRYAQRARPKLLSRCE